MMLVNKKITAMKILHLTIKKKWFDMILSGEKKAEYREFKQYYITRFCDMYVGSMGGDFMDAHKVISYKFKHFDAVSLRNGYSSFSPTMLIEFKSFMIGMGFKDWGAPDEPVFILNLGEILETKNLFNREQSVQESDTSKAT